MSNETAQPKKEGPKVGDTLPQAAQETVRNLTLLMLGVREGMGLSHACQMSGNDIKEVSRLATQYPDFRKELEDATAAGRLEYLRAAGDFLANNDMERTNKARRDATSIPDVNLWQGVCSAEEVSPELVINTYVKVKIAREVATLVGMEWDAFVKYVTNKPVIRQMVAELTNEKVL